MDRITAVKAIARNLKDLIIDTVPASLTGSSVYAKGFIHPQSAQLLGRTFYPYSGAGLGQERTVASYSPSAKSIVFADVFASIPSLNTAFFLTDFWSKSDYDNAIDRTIGKAKMKYLVDSVATMALVASQYEYAVPTGLEYISTLRIVPSGNSWYSGHEESDIIFELPPRFWRIERNPLGSYIIAFDARKINLDEFDGEWVRVEGQAQPDIAATDNAVIPADLEEYVIAGASMQLASTRMTSSYLHEEWKDKFYMFRNVFAELDEQIFRYGRGKKVR